MIRLAILFFVMAFIGQSLGSHHMLGINQDTGQTLLLVFLVMGLVVGLIGVFNQRSKRQFFKD